MHHYLFLSFLISLFLSCGQTTPITTTQNDVIKNEILWDTWGVPHIYATDEVSLFYGFGRAQMESHGDLIVKLYAESRGRAAEYWGEKFLEKDKQVHTLGINKKAEVYYDNIADGEKIVVDAFVKGLNAYIADHPGHLSERYNIALPLMPVDVLAHTFRVFYIEFLANRELGKVPTWMAGSNAWVVGPKRSASGKAMLLTNPHLAWHDFWLFYEAHFVTNELNLYGATLVGMPNMGVGFNDHLGWTHTVNTIDAVDLFEVVSKDGKYKMNDEEFSLSQSEVELKVKQSDDTYRTEKLQVTSTIHGPVISSKGNKLLAMRIAHTEDPPQMLTQWKAMGEAKNFKEFEAALKLHQLPMFNVMYADKDGNIFYHFGGHVPIRKTGDWAHWQGVVSGNEKNNLWTKYHPYEDLPKLLNPENGWMQNANDPPYTNTVPTVLNPDDYPPYMSPVSMNFRPQRSANILSADSSITFEEFAEYKQSTVMETAERLLDDLFALKDQVKSKEGKEALKILSEWDKTAETNSKGAVLFANWYLMVNDKNPYGLSVYAKPWDFNNPNHTPDGIKNPKKAIAVLEAVAKDMKSKYGRLDVEWGEIYRLKGGTHDFPANGGMGWLGEFRTVWFQPDGNKFRAVHGDTYVAAIEFGEQPRAKVLLSYGNATQPGNKHIGDQLELFSKKEMRDAWRDRSAIEANLEKKEGY